MLLSVLRLALTAMHEAPLDRHDGLLHALKHPLLCSLVKFVQKIAPHMLALPGEQNTIQGSLHYLLILLQHGVQACQ